MAFATGDESHDKEEEDTLRSSIPSGRVSWYIWKLYLVPVAFSITLGGVSSSGLVKHLVHLNIMRIVRLLLLLTESLSLPGILLPGSSSRCCRGGALQMEINSTTKRVYPTLETTPRSCSGSPLPRVASFSRDEIVNRMMENWRDAMRTTTTSTGRAATEGNSSNIFSTAAAARVVTKSRMDGSNLNFIFENDLMWRKVNLSCLTDIERDTTF